MTAPGPRVDLPGPALHTRRVRVACGLLVVLAACGPRGNPPLVAAGANGDDGVGVLARSSVRLTYTGAGDDDGETYSESDDPGRGHDDYDPLAYYGYGSFGYGGFGYGGFGYGGIIGWNPNVMVAPPAYEGSGGGSSGAIEGTLTWKADGGVAWPPGCALARTARAGAPVAGAVVYVDKLTRGRAPNGRTGGIVTATGCGFEPAVQLVGPLPAGVVIENASARAAPITVAAASRDQVVLDPGGRVEVPVGRPGVVAIDAPGGAPAWVVGQAHPYYTITDDAGRFALDLVPSGAHTLVIWSPPLATAAGPGGATWSPPIVQQRTVIVPVDGVATVTATLAPP